MKKVPQELISRKQWVCWKTVERDGKETKLPFQPSGKSAKSNDSSTWSDFETVALAAETFDGPGFVFSADDPYVGIDLDGCRDPETGLVEPWAKEIVLKFDSYAEVSPSKTGVKIFAKGDWKFDGGRKCTVSAKVICKEKIPGIEVYSQKRYFAVTGKKLANISGDVEHRQEAIDWLVKKYFTGSSQPAYQRGPLHTDEGILKRAEKYLEKIPAAVSGQRGHDRTFQAACVLVLGFGLPEGDALALLSDWNQGCEPPWTQKELEHKVSDAAKQSGPRNYLRDKQPEEWDRVSVPRYGEFQSKPEPKQVLEIGTLEDAAEIVLQEIAGGKKTNLITTGLYDLDGAIGGGYELGEMVVLAARPSHGKSTFALQLAHTANANGIPVIMVSEEMSARSLGKRVLQFASAIPEENWHLEHGAVKYDVFEHFKSRAKTYVVETVQTANRAVEEIEKAVEERGVKIAIVDYAQLLKSDGKGRYEQTTNTSIALKSAANRLGITIVCLCQLSRDIEGRSQFVPRSSDLKDSGQFEQDADVILFLVWPHKLDPNKDPNEYQVFVAKNRNRAINEHCVKLKFQPSRQMIEAWMPKPTGGWPTSKDLGFD